jgi:hypothetical protein
MIDALSEWRRDAYALLASMQETRPAYLEVAYASDLEQLAARVAAIESRLGMNA